MKTRYYLLPLILAPLCLAPGGSSPVGGAPSAGEKPKSDGKPRSDEKPKAADPLPVSKIRIRTADDFPEGFKQFAGPLGALDRLRQQAELMRDTDADFNRPGPQNIHRWEWLTATRKNIEYYDKLCREAAKEERAFWEMYNASSNPNKKFLESKALEFVRFQKHRLEMRRSWYYTACGHHWRWEQEGPVRPLNHRLLESLAKMCGCTTWDFRVALAWFDLILTDTMPGVLYSFTIPFALMSK